MKIVVHVSTFGQNCGIGAYATHVLDGFRQVGDTTMLHVEVPLRSDIAKKKLSFLDRMRHYLSIKLPVSDLLLIQHEFGIWGRTHQESLIIFLAFLLKNFQSSKKILVFVHTLADLNLDKAAYIPRRYRPVYQVGNWLFGLLLKLATSYLRCSILVHSARVADYVKTHYKIDPNKILVHPHPFVTSIADGDVGGAGECAKDALFLKESILQTVGTQNPVLVGIFGFVNRYKGHELAVEAIRSLPPNYHLVVLGITHPENEINPTMDYISKFKILYPNRITLHCHASDDEAAAFLRVCDVLVAPYLPVNLSASGAFTYCLASRVPVIASNIPAFMDILSETEAFVKINHGSVEQLAAAILEVSNNKFLRNRVVRSALIYADQYSFSKFSWFLTRSLITDRV